MYASVAIAYVSARTFYFVTNQLDVFKNKAKASPALLYRQIGQFSIMAVINYLITLFLIWIIQKYTGEVYSGSVVAGIVTTILAYLVFNKIFARQ